jgi:DUF3047 family protein
MRREAVVGLVLAGSMFSAIPGVRGEDCVALADLTNDPVGAFPAEWRVRKDAGKAVYSVREEDRGRVLHAASKGVGIQAALQHEWDLDAYPILAWSWRPVVFPHGADERRSSTNDSALAVYLLVPYSRIRGPKAVKYIWSERVPTGTPLSSNHGLTQVVVLRTGTDKKGQWADERVDARSDYKRLFGESETPKPVGIAILTDSDDTRSSAEGEYANFRVCRQ